MDIIDLREYILSLPLVEECQPFGDDAVVYKVGGRMFACCVLEIGRASCRERVCCAV